MLVSLGMQFRQLQAGMLGQKRIGVGSDDGFEEIPCFLFMRLERHGRRGQVRATRGRYRLTRGRRLGELLLLFLLGLLLEFASGSVVLQLAQRSAGPSRLVEQSEARFALGGFLCGGIGLILEILHEFPQTADDLFPFRLGRGSFFRFGLSVGQRLVDLVEHLKQFFPSALSRPPRAIGCFGTLGMIPGDAGKDIASISQPSGFPQGQTVMVAESDRQFDTLRIARQAPFVLLPSRFQDFDCLARLVPRPVERGEVDHGHGSSLRGTQRVILETIQFIDRSLDVSLPDKHFGPFQHGRGK